MSDQHWERVKEVFHQAARQPLEEREAFLDAACGTDAELRLEVEGLLFSHDEIGDDSITSRTEVARESEGQVFPVEGPGSVIGNYKLLEKIGEGGMGVVYLAEQERPVRRRVALKIIKLGMDTREVIARFEAERQALAMMDHTNIAKVFDAGTTELGRPYFVMEHVPGIPITEYCDEHRLNAEERLRLYVPVCQAIHHAHQQAIIHRDVKPSNVLVKIQDGKPVPKVIDFGVAKATNQRLTEKTLYTGQGVFIGTPAYMSPEQAEMTGLNVDTTTDVYSLGALLYELLVGAPPFDPKSLREAGLEAIHRMIREVDPPKPSARFSDLGDEGTTVAEKRRTEPATLERQIRGELDWITMRAMEKDRTRRYQSASEFAADIERYLSDEPVLASPPSTTYRMRKFVRRNKTGVAFAATAVAILVVFAVTMTVQADRIARERDRAQLEAKRSRVEAELLQAILLDDAHGGNVDTHDFVTLSREAWGMHRRSLAGDPAGLALAAVNILRLLDVHNMFNKNEGEETEVRRFRDELEPAAFNLIYQAMAERDTTVLKTVDLMITRQEEWENERDDVRDIAPLYRDAIAMRRETLSSRDPALIQRLTNFANLLEARGRRSLTEGRPADAELILRELLQLRLEVDQGSGGQPHDAAVAKGLLGESLMGLARYAEAEPYLVESAEILETWTARRHVIDLYESWGKSDRAESNRKNLLVESVREMGPLGTLEVSNSHRCFSGFFEGRSVWVFHGNMSYGWAWTDDTDASDGIGLFEPARVAGGRRELLPLTPDEVAVNNNDSSVDSGRWVLLPGAIIADPERSRALVVYWKDLVGPRQKHAGWSLAVWENPDSAVVRPIVRPGTEYPTMLFQDDEPRLGAGAVADGGFLYLYQADYVSCIVARAPLADALNRNAWRFYAGEAADEKWATAWTSAANIAMGSRSTIGVLSVSWSEHLKKYLVVSGFPSSNPGGIVIRTADRPEGPWSSDELIIEGLRTVWPADDGSLAFANHGLMAHPEFAREGGRIQYMTYSRRTGWFGREIRLLEVVFR